MDKNWSRYREGEISMEKCISIVKLIIPNECDIGFILALHDLSLDRVK